MIKYTENEAESLNNLSPGNQNALIGDVIRDIQEAIGGVATAISGVTIKPMVTIEYEITADGSSGLNIFNSNCPFTMRIIDVVVEARATSASGTVTASDGTNNITDAIACDTDTNLDRASTIDNAYSTLEAGDSLVVTTNGASDRGLVTILIAIG
jgi:hypothetical protein